MRNSIKAIAVLSFASSPLLVNAEGLERININPSFMFNEGGSAEISFASINPSLPATEGALFDLTEGLDVAPSFTALTLAVKTELGDNLDIGVFYTDNGNGVLIDYGTIPAATSAGAAVDWEIAADLEMPTIAALAKYSINENMSVFAGIKRVTVKDGAFVKTGGDTNPLDVDTRISDAPHWVLSEKSEMGAVYGAAYEMPEIALRVSLMVEDGIELEIPTTVGGGTTAAAGTSEAGIGDAITLNFQSGIAEDTLLFGSIRRSNWEDYQVKVPVPGPALRTLSEFENGTSYNLGVGRKISDDLSLSLSAFYDGGDGADASELAPTGANRSISLGGKYSVSENADLSLGASYSKRGDATTGSIGATLEDSTVLTIGSRLSFNF